MTKLQADYGLIDHRYYFDLSELKSENVKQNDVIKYIAYRRDVNAEWKVKDVRLSERNEWQKDTITTEQESLITRYVT